MYTVGRIVLVAAIAATVSLVAPSAHANKLTEAEGAKKTEPQVVAKPARTAKDIRAEKLRAVIDPDLGFGLGPIEQPKPAIAPAKKKESKRAMRRRVRLEKRQRDESRAHSRAQVMGVKLDGRQTMKRASAEEIMVLDEQNLSDREIKRAIRANRESVDVCIERVVAHGKAPTGHANATFTVEPLGHVTSVRVSAGGASGKRLARCMTRAIKHWKFPASDAQTEVEFPFVLDIAGATLSAEE